MLLTHIIIISLPPQPPRPPSPSPFPAVRSHHYHQRFDKIFSLATRFANVQKHFISAWDIDVSWGFNEPQEKVVIGDADYYSNGIGGAASDVTRGKLLQVVLVSPQIAGNTGSIARTCAASAVALHLVEPLGYKIDDTKLKRAGLDYWPYVVVKVHASWADFLEYFRRQAGEKRLLAFTKKGTSIHSDVKYKQGDWLVFGSEVSGLPPEALVDCTREGMGGGTVKIPMVDTYVRCLNLSVSVGIALYEASRQLNYEQLQCPDAGVEGQRPFISEDAFG